MASQTATNTTFQDALEALKDGMTSGASHGDIMSGITTLIKTFPDEFKVEAVKDTVQKRAKKVRDPTLPKRPKNAFMFFTASIREDVKTALIASSPDGKIRVADVSKECGTRWKAMSDSDKQPFLDANSAAKVDYEKAMESYYAENPDKMPAEKVKKEKTAGGGTKKKGFQTDTDAETAFDSELPDGWKKGSIGYLSGAVKGEDGKPLKFKTFAEAVDAAGKLDCGGITRTKMAYTLRKSSTVKDSTTGEFSWTRVKSENGTASSDSDSE